MKKIKEILKKIKENLIFYIINNKLFLSFVILLTLMNVLVRDYTIGNGLQFNSLIVDLCMSLLIGVFAYLFKPKNRFKYFMVWMIIFTFLAVANSIYFQFYQSFVSVSLISSMGQIGTVSDSIIDKFEIRQIIYVIFPMIFWLIHRSLNKGNHYYFVSIATNAKKMFASTILFISILLATILVTLTPTDYSRIAKQWNKEYIVERFGVALYQFNDVIQSLTPKLGSLFGYEEAAKDFTDFYSNNKVQISNNEYTNKFEGYNVIFVHMESMQAFLMDLEFNGQKVTPNLDNLAKEGLFFNNFYSQVSTGTSSDTEFTLTNSLMPAQAGTVFVSYYDRDYLAIPEILKNKGYYTYSAHANKPSMWNRIKMHPQLGYEDMFFYDSYNIDEIVGLGLSDKSFFRQLVPMMEKIEDEKSPYMGTIITLSNHSSFSDLDKYGEFDLGYTRVINNEDGTTEEVRDEYLNEKKLGNYIKSAHYADSALGEFLNSIKSSDKFDKTLFVFYGDHDAKLSKSEFNFYYNYDLATGQLKKKGDEGYVNYDYYAHELNRRVPLILWTKNGEINGEVNYPMGMIDILPTVGNMMGFNSPYQLGHDIFEIKNDNIVIFPNANFLTDKVYYYNSKEEYIVFDQQPIDDDYINSCKEYADTRLNISNDIIVYDLIKKEGNSLK